MNSIRTMAIELHYKHKLKDMLMESIIQIFRMEELSVNTRISIIKKLGGAINHQFGASCTEELVIELILALDPEKEPELRDDKRYAAFMK
ncbi:MAG: hypothetical protein OEM38_00360 [Gammaproteobacteria bacterium]|nr:hypothetical protein [Gammaproteobacteria bacterium]